MKSFSLLVLFCFSAIAQDYTLWQAENEHFRDYTREQLMERLGSSSYLLPNYACNDRDELNPFWQAPRENQNEDSLKIQLHPSLDQIIYKQGSYLKLNGEIQTDFSHDFISQVVIALNKIEAIPEGARLLRNLERSYFPITIQQGNNMFNPRDDSGRSYRGIYRANALSAFAHGRMTSEDILFNDIGTGGSIHWNPKTSDVPSYVALMHEMYHAFDSTRGILDMRFVNGEKYESAFVSEYRAVYFENIARQHYGHPLRTHYGSDRSGPGVLDENGNSRWMPSPCLKD
jgi:hypothetical protein